MCFSNLGLWFWEEVPAQQNSLFGLDLWGFAFELNDLVGSPLYSHNSYLNTWVKVSMILGLSLVQLLNSSKFNLSWEDPNFKIILSVASLNLCGERSPSLVMLLFSNRDSPFLLFNGFYAAITLNPNWFSSVSPPATKDKWRSLNDFPFRVWNEMLEFLLNDSSISSDLGSSTFP